MDHPKEAVINLGCGLETTFWRNDNGQATFIELDLPEVTELRRTLLPETLRDHIITASMFDPAWIKEMSSTTPGPYLVLASGLFYYFEKSRVIELINQLSNLGECELVFDAVNHIGLKRMAGYMRKMGHADATMCFYVDNPAELVSELSVSAEVLNDIAYYSLIGSKRGLSLVTRMSMAVSDRFGMLHMIHLHIEGDKSNNSRN